MRGGGRPDAAGAVVRHRIDTLCGVSRSRNGPHNVAVQSDDSRRRVSLKLAFSLALAVPACCGIAWFVLQDGLEVADRRASVGGLFVALASLCVAVLALRPGARRGRQGVDEPGTTNSDVTLLNRLAVQVHRHWADETKRREIREFTPLEIRWSLRTDAYRFPASTDPAGTPTGPGDIAVTLEQLTERLLASSSQQLVVIGDAGSGKSDMAVLLLLEVLRRREEGTAGAVPVLLPLDTWQPRHISLEQWIAAEISERYAQPAESFGIRPAAVRRLLRERKLIPILDGFDELPRGLQKDAIDKINKAFGRDTRIVVTSRTREYEQAWWAEKPLLASADVVEVMPADARAVIAFLGSRLAGFDRMRWQPLFDALRRNPTCPAGRALSTPLMVRSVEKMYASEKSRPGELTDIGRFPDRHSVEHHLMPGLMELAYPKDATERRYSHEQALRWLVFLATTLHRTGSRDLAWWRLHRAVPRAASVLVATVLLAMGGFGTAFVGTGLVVFADARSNGSDGVAAVAWWALRNAAWGALAGVLVGLMSAFSSPPSSPDGPSPWRPSRPLQPPVRRRPWSVFLCGAAGGFVLGLALDHAGDHPLLLVFGVGLGAVVGACATLVYKLDDRWTAPADLSVARDPEAAHRHDAAANRRRLILIGIGAGVVIALVGGLTLILRWNGVARAADGTVLIGGWAVTIAVFAAWANWLRQGASGWFLVSRIWLTARRRLPLRLFRFLDDASTTPVLRRAGPFYQFRHPRLQDWLAGRPLLDEAALWELNGWVRRAHPDAGAADDRRVQLVNAGVDHWLAGRRQDAESCWREAGDHPDAVYDLAMLLTSGGSLDEAEPLWRHAARAGDAEAMRWLGVLADRAGNPREAEQRWTRAVQLGCRTAGYELCLHLFSRGRADEANQQWGDLGRRRWSSSEWVVRPDGSHRTDGVRHRRPAIGASLLRAAAGYAPSSGDDRAERMLPLEAGLLLYEQGHPQAAEDWWRKAVIDGERRACVFLSLLARGQKRKGEAEYWQRRAQQWSTPWARSGRFLRRALQQRWRLSWRSGRWTATLADSGR